MMTPHSASKINFHTGYTGKKFAYKGYHSVIKKIHEHLLRFFNKWTFNLLWHEGFYVAQYLFKLIAYSNYINTFKKIIMIFK